MAVPDGLNYQVPCLCSQRAAQARAMTEPKWWKCRE